MANGGGFFKGKSWFDDNGKEYAFAFCWGTLIGDAEDKTVNKRRIDFTVKYHRGAFINCTAWGDTEAVEIASSLEKGDMVLCFGTYDKYQYTKKDGTQGERYNLNVDFVLPLSLVKMMLQQLGTGFASVVAPSDAMESANDHVGEGQLEGFTNLEDDEMPF